MYTYSLNTYNVHVHVHNHSFIYCTCRNVQSCTHIFREMRRKEERSKQGQTNNKAKQHSIPIFHMHVYAYT